MTDRRVFLKAAAALSAAPFAARAAFAGRTAGADYDAFVFDSRHAAAREFAARAAQLNVPTRGIAGDITSLWQRELVARWRAGPAAIAGLTERPALFLLEQLGWEHGLRVVFQAEHGATSDAAAAHRVLRGAGTGLGRELGAAGTAWPVRLADSLLAGVARPAADFRPSGAAMAEHRNESDKL